jgi:hypothetical protein
MPMIEIKVWKPSEEDEKAAELFAIWSCAPKEERPLLKEGFLGGCRYRDSLLAGDDE